MGEGRVEVVGEPRASGARRLVRRPEHQVVDEQLRAAVDQLERLLAVLGVERVLLVDSNPRQILPLLRNLLVQLGELPLARVYRLDGSIARV